MGAARIVVTGAEGFLGGWLVREALSRGGPVLALVYVDPGNLPATGARVERADVTVPADLARVLRPGDVVIHAAGVVSIDREVRPEVAAVNVGGTQHVVDACRAAGVRRLVYVSSVHALPELPHGRVHTEIRDFDPAAVVGEYAATKAEATRRVLAAAGGLDVVVVHPGGLIGPGGRRSHTGQLLADAISGRLPATVPGGYDWVDVRDVAAGTLAAAERGRPGECYLLTGRWLDVRRVVAQAVDVAGGPRTRRRLPPHLPRWLVALVAPVMERVAAWRGAVPTLTSYSLHTLAANGRFSHAKAAAELGYTLRPWRVTIEDTVADLRRASRDPHRGGRSRRG